MESYRCALGEHRPQACKEFPKRQSDINDCGRAIGEKSTCVAEIGGANCDNCGQCCRDDPFPDNKEWLNEYIFGAVKIPQNISIITPTKACPFLDRVVL